MVVIAATAFFADSYSHAQSVAKAHAGEGTLDLSQVGDFSAALGLVYQLLEQDDCAAATPVLEALAVAQPQYLAVHQLLYVCDMTRGDIRSAATRLDVMQMILPDGPQRDQALTLRRNLAYATGPVFSVFGDITPSSNYNKQTAAEQLNGWTIPEENRATQGTLLQAGASAGFGVFTAGNIATTAVVSLSVETNDRSWAIAPRLGFELPTTIQSGSVLYGFGPLVSYRFENGSHDETRFGGKGFASWQLDHRSSLRFDTTIYRNTYSERDHLNGTVVRTASSLSHLLTPEVQIGAHVSAQFDLYDASSLNRTTLEAGVSLDYAPSNGWRFGTGATLGGRWHNRPPPMSVGENQTDRFVSAYGEIGHAALTFGAVRPMLHYQYTKQFSDNVFYEHESHDFGLRLRANL